MTRPRKTPAPAPAPTLDADPADSPADAPAATLAAARPTWIEKLSELGALVAQNPNAYGPTVRVYRIPPGGDGQAAAHVADMPAGSLVDATAWLSAERTCGPGVYRLDVLHARGQIAGSVVGVRVDSDRRPQAAPQAPPTAAAPPAPSDVSAAILAELRGLSQRLERVERGEQAPAGPSRLMELRELMELTKLMPGAPPPPGADAERLVKLGVDLAQTLASASGNANASIWATLLDKHLPEVLAIGRGGVDLARELTAKKRAEVEARAKEAAVDATATVVDDATVDAVEGDERETP